MTHTQTMETLRPAIQEALEHGTILEVVATLILDIAPLIEEEELNESISFALSVA